MKRPNSHQPNFYTIILDLGPNIPAFQQHFTDPERAGRALRALIAKMNAAANLGTIEGLQLWHRGGLISSYRANPPKTPWIPPKDPDGVRRIPERGVKRPQAKRPHSLPATTPALPRPAMATATNGKFKLVL